MTSIFWTVGAVSAEDSFDFMVRVLSDAQDKGALPDPMQEVLIDLLTDREEDESGFDYLVAVLTAARDAGIWDDSLSSLLAEYVIEFLIVPKTGETLEQVRERLSEADRFAKWNRLEPQDWWRDSEPYSCQSLGSDPLSLIKYYGNGSYLRHGFMGFSGCTPMKRYPDRTHLDPPIDPKYYSLGELEIAVDIVRVPPDAPGWFEDDGKRENMTMAQAVDLLNEHIARYYGRISEGKLSMRFVAGNDFELEGEGTPNDVHDQQMRLAGVMDCRGEAKDKYPCNQGAPGGLNRTLLTDVSTDEGGDAAFNGSARLGLVSLRKANMETLVHEIGHAWMGWPHSFAEVYWEGEGGVPNPYSNRLDFMSGLNLIPVLGWYRDMPSTLAVNRYSAGWIEPGEVALHHADKGTYTLQPPRRRGYQFLVIPSGRKWAFTIVEVLDERNSAYRDDPSFRYDGVLVSRYDQTAGTGLRTRFGPALHDSSANDVNMGRDDFSVMQDGEVRDLGGGVSLEVSRNRDGSYEVSVSGGQIAEFKPWCEEIWFAFGEYDTGCALDK